MALHRRALLVVASALAVAPVLAGGAAPQQKPMFRAETRTVPIYATVTDQDHRLVPGLAREDFEVRDEGKVQQLVLFDNQAQPITVVVMLDSSGSMTLNLEFVRQGAEQFFLRLLPLDHARLGDFNDKIELLTPFTSDRDLLISALKDTDFGNPTRLWDAIDTSLDELRSIDGRRVVLVFTDGDDNSSRTATLGKVLDRARAEEVMIYAIGLQSDYFNGAQRVQTRPTKGLKKLADETGGGYFELERTDQLTSTFTRVSEELHSQYLLGFTTETLDGKVHELEVRVKKPGMKVRARRSYLATAPGTRTTARNP